MKLMKNQTILITGATGFLGRALARALADRGDTVRGLSRSEREASPGDAISQWYRWSGGTDAIPAEAVAGADAVVHLAGESVVGRWSDAKKRRILGSRVNGTQAVVEAIRAAGDDGPQVLVSASAIGYYGDRGDEKLTETSSSPEGDFLADVCRAWEEEATKAETLGARVVKVRIGLVMHPEGGALKAMLTPFKMGLGGKMGSGKQWQSWIHRDDLVSMLLFALDRDGLSGPMNATAPNPVTQKEFAKTLGKAIGRPTFMPAPAFAIRAALGEFAVELLSSKRVLPVVADDAGFRFQFPDLAGALADLVGKKREAA